MQLKKRRINRVRDEMRVWLRRHHGYRVEYTRADIDNGREELGFDGVEDALVAYTLFGGDFAPSFASSLGFSMDDVSLVVHSMMDAGVNTLDAFDVD